VTSNLTIGTILTCMGIICDWMAVDSYLRSEHKYMEGSKYLLVAAVALYYGLAAIASDIRPQTGVLVVSIGTIILSVIPTLIILSIRHITNKEGKK
jgi:hypothetical protein